MSVARQMVEACEFVYEDGEETTVHTHDTHQLVYAKSGLLTLFVHNSRWVVPPLRAVWVPAGTPHSLLAHGVTNTRPLYFSRNTRIDIDGTSVVSVSPLLRALIAELGSSRDIDDEERHHLEQLVLHQLRRMAVRPLELTEPAEPRLAEISRALNADPSDRRTLRDWGQAVGASERTLVRLFARHTGTTFGRWRSQLRLHHSLILLAQGTSVTSTALRCGYRSTSAFIDSFRSTLGTTPGAYLKPDEVDGN